MQGTGPGLVCQGQPLHLDDRGLHRRGCCPTERRRGLGRWRPVLTGGVNPSAARLGERLRCRDLHREAGLRRSIARRVQHHPRHVESGSTPRIRPEAVFRSTSACTPTRPGPGASRAPAWVRSSGSWLHSYLSAHRRRSARSSTCSSSCRWSLPRSLCFCSRSCSSSGTTRAQALTARYGAPNPSRPRWCSPRSSLRKARSPAPSPPAGWWWPR